MNRLARSARVLLSRRRARRPGAPKPPVWYGLVIVVGSLVVIGLVMVLSASSVEAQRESGSSVSYFLRQATWTVIGLLAFAVTSRVDYRRWRALIPVLLVGSFALLLLVLLPGFGVRVNGARSWLAVGPLTFQPAELVKLAILLYSADLLARRASRMNDPRMTLNPVLMVVGATALVMMLQPDLGSTIVVVGIAFAVLFVSGVPLGRLTAWTAAAGVAGTVLALSADYRRERILSFLDPANSATSAGYQLSQSLTGIASGGVFGVGLGESRAKWGFLPNAHTDFIYAVIAEELGLVGALVVVVLFLALALLGVKTALDAPDRYGCFVAAGITAWLLAQAFVNIGGVVGILPITGLTLPFVSFGGTSLLVTLATTGMLLNIAAAGAERQRAKARADHPARRPALATS